MELRGDQHNAGGAYLNIPAGPPYPWEYWIGLSLWTGEYVYLKHGVDWPLFRSRAGFVNTARHAAGAYGCKAKCETRNLPENELKVLFYRPNEVPAEEYIEIPQ